NLATAYTGTVKFSSTDLQAALPANYTFTAADAGIHVFNATLKTAGTQTITALDTVTATITGKQTGISVTAASPAKLAVTGFPNPAAAGVAGTLTVTSQDTFGNLSSGYLGTVTFSSSDAQAVLAANYIFVAADAGVHTFSATPKTSGSKIITATDTVTSSITGSQTVTVNAAAAATMTLAGFTNPTVAGVAHNIIGSLFDAFGNVATGYRGTVHFTSTDAQATLPANYTYTSVDNGVHTFSVTLKTVGTQSITETDTVTSSLTATQSGITVNQAAASNYTVTGFPSPQTAGIAGSFTVTAKDAFGNLATAYTGTVKFSSSEAQAALPANYPFTAADAGVHVFSATLKTAATQAITATDTVSGTITGKQTGISITAAAPAKLAVTGFPNPA